MIKIKNKSGISLIVLSIVLMVLVMLSGVIVYIGYDIMVTAKNTVFAKDIQTISDAISEYYAVNGSAPILNSGLEITSEKYIENIGTLVGEKAQKALNDEFIINNDQSTVFYEVDMSKIGIEDVKYGIKSNENDLFLISSNSNVVYYYVGYENNSGIYFSNSVLVEK